ncbi:MAG: hypothetical protein JXA57_20325 [Armatimonadetes bacterium]|nr:hypothetical protein [Armatimonadota bacterium]
MSNDFATVDRCIGEAETDVSASGLWSETFVKRPKVNLRLGQLAPIAGIILSFAAPPATAIPDFWFWEKRKRDAAAVVSIVEGVFGRAISRAEAISIAQKIIDRAERERLRLAEWEAGRGIQWEDGE